MYEDFFAERLAALREQKKVSAREMSLSLGQNSSYINRIENKQAFPSMQSFFYICEYLGISPKDFFDTDSQNPIKLTELINQMKNLNEMQLDILISVVKGFQHNF